ncbi:hypothetical protein BGZ83_000053 [Gryganskiella cystojenkinii]|nr:hypothetical protein BGZ83_000053 [Gryganskiella cystojenkinii]
MFIRSAIIASAALALLANLAESHSWADCVDWRFNDPNKPDFSATGGKCFGWARKYPLAKKAAFASLDSADPNRHYQQSKTGVKIPCSDTKHGEEPGSDETRQDPISKAYGGQWGTMASVLAGGKMCVRWPAKNHAKKDEQDRGVFINMPQTLLTKDPNQDDFTKANIAKIPYKNCNFLSSSDTTPCGGCFTVPANLTTGIYVVQWRWELNDNEWYTSCWDLGVTGIDGNSTSSDAPLGGSTSIFAELAEDD